MTALLVVAGCGGAAPAGSDAPPADAPASATGFDACSLVEPDRVAELIGVEAVYVTARSAVRLSDTSRQAGCRYFTEDVPGLLGMELTTVAGTNPEQFFKPFTSFKKRETLDNLGDRTEVVVLSAEGIPTRFIQVRTIAGDRGLHLHYAYRKDGSGDMPELDGSAAALLMATALERLPDEVEILDGAPEGRCADLDLGPAAEAVGGELTMARSVESGDGGLSCWFGGDQASVEIAVLADPKRAQVATIAPDRITHPDLGDGALLFLADDDTLEARVNLGDRVVAVTAEFHTTVAPVTEPRAGDVEMVRAIVDGIAPQR